MEAGLMKRILLSGSGILYKIYNILYTELSRTNFCAELSCVELSGNLWICILKRCQRLTVKITAKPCQPAYMECTLHTAPDSTLHQEGWAYMMLLFILCIVYFRLYYFIMCN